MLQGYWHEDKTGWYIGLLRWLGMYYLYVGTAAMWLQRRGGANLGGKGMAMSTEPGRGPLGKMGGLGRWEDEVCRSLWVDDGIPWMARKARNHNSIRVRPSLTGLCRVKEG